MSRRAEIRPGPLGRAWGRVRRWWNHAALWRKGTTVLALPLVALWPTLAAGAYLLHEQHDLRLQSRASTDAVDDAGDLLQLVVDAETGVRGYAATGDPSFLVPYRSAVDDLPAALDALADGVPPTQADVPTDLEQLIDEELVRLDALQQSVADDASTAEVLALTQAGRQTTDEIRATVGDLEDSLDAEVVERRADVDDLTDTTSRLLVLSIVLGGVAGYGAMVLFTNGVARRLTALDANIDRFLDGEPFEAMQVSDDEIGVLAQGFVHVAEVLTERDDQLRQSRDEALAAAQAKDLFLSRMSHELRTPLTAVIGFGQLLQLEDLGPGDRESVDHIVDAGRHLLALIDEVLDIAMIETGHLSLSVEPVDLDELLADATSLMGPTAAGAGITVVPAGPTEVGVLADRQRLRQVLLNLLSNTIKYNRPQGTVTVHCRVVGSSTVRIAVADTGRGIPAEDRDRVFAPFDRIEAEHTDVEGSGVGLALSKGLVEAMGGNLDLDSVVGKGSTFWVELPRVEVLRHVPDLPWADRMRPTGTPGAAPVLVVEDNAANTRVLERIFRRREESLEVTGHGQQALELAVRLQPRLILLDLNLPDLDGAEVLQRLKAEPRTASIPVVIVSADLSPGRQHHLLRLGAHDLLPKPLDFGRLLELLDESVAAPATHASEQV